MMNKIYRCIFRKLLSKVDFLSVSKTGDTKEYVITFWEPKARTSLWLKKAQEDDKQHIRAITKY